MDNREIREQVEKARIEMLDAHAAFVKASRNFDIATSEFDAATAKLEAAENEYKNLKEKLEQNEG